MAQIRWGNDEGICIYLFRYHFVKLVTIIHGSVHLETYMYLIQALNNMACTCMHTIGFLCTCLHSLLGTLGTCCIACTQCTMTSLTLSCMLTSAPLSNSIWTHSMCPASEAFISAVTPSCNDKSAYHHGITTNVKYTLPIRVIESAQGPAPHTVQQHIPLTLKRHHWEEHTVLPHTP